MRLHCNELRNDGSRDANGHNVIPVGGQPALEEFGEQGEVSTHRAHESDNNFRVVEIVLCRLLWNCAAFAHVVHYAQTVLRRLWRDAVAGDKCCRVAIGRRDAGGGDGLAGFFAAGDFEVQGEELGEEVLFRVEGVGVEDGGVEGGVGVLERGSQAAGNLDEGVGADAAEFDGGGGDGVDLLLAWGLGPGEGVETDCLVRYEAVTGNPGSLAVGSCAGWCDLRG